MFRTIIAAALATFMALPAAQATTLHEADFGEFGDVYSQPSDFTGYSQIFAASNGLQDFEYFVFNAVSPDTTRIDFTLSNFGAGSNMLIRLSSTPFTMAEWDWRISELDAGNMQARELYANQWAPTDTYSFLLPDGFQGPLYGFARFYGTNSPSTLSISVDGASVAPVPLPASMVLLLAGLGALGVLRAKRIV